MRAVIAISAAALLGAAYVMWRQSQDETVALIPDDVSAVINDATQGAAQWVDEWTGGTLKLSAMAQVTPALLSNGNVKAFLRVIRRGEGTSDDGGYKRLFGGGTFSSLAQHPNIKVTKGSYTSTAAGAYQFLKSVWDETARIMNLPDFSPASQDLGAVGRIAARGALGDVIAGRFDAAVKKCANEWASLPYSPYGQPTISMQTAAAVFASAGGIVTA